MNRTNRVLRGFLRIIKFLLIPRVLRTKIEPFENHSFANFLNSRRNPPSKLYVEFVRNRNASATNKATKAMLLSFNTVFHYKNLGGFSSDFGDTGNASFI